MKKSISILILSFFIVILNCNGQDYIVRSMTTVSDEVTIDQSELKEKTLKKMTEWTNLIKIIGDKRRSDKERERAINSATKLFVPDATIEVSSKSNKNKTYSVEEYLHHLRDLNYREVTIDYYESVDIGNFEQGEDGNYYSNAKYFQSFTGTDAKGKKYSDKTVKETKIVADVIEKYKNLFSDGEPSIILLGSIKVLETK